MGVQMQSRNSVETYNKRIKDMIIWRQQIENTFNRPGDLIRSKSIFTTPKTNTRARKN